MVKAETLDPFLSPTSLVPEHGTDRYVTDAKTPFGTSRPRPSGPSPDRTTLYVRDLTSPCLFHDLIKKVLRCKRESMNSARSKLVLWDCNPNLFRLTVFVRIKGKTKDLKDQVESVILWNLCSQLNKPRRNGRRLTVLIRLWKIPRRSTLSNYGETSSLGKDVDFCRVGVSVKVEDMY